MQTGLPPLLLYVLAHFSTLTAHQGLCLLVFQSLSSKSSHIQDFSGSSEPPFHQHCLKKVLILNARIYFHSNPLGKGVHFVFTTKMKTETEVNYFLCAQNDVGVSLN